MVDIRHAAAFGFGFDRLLGLFLCSDKEDALSLFDDASDRVIRLNDAR